MTALAIITGVAALGLMVIGTHFDSAPMFTMGVLDMIIVVPALMLTRLRRGSR